MSSHPQALKGDLLKFNRGLHLPDQSVKLVSLEGSLVVKVCQVVAPWLFPLVVRAAPLRLAMSMCRRQQHALAMQGKDQCESVRAI